MVGLHLVVKWVGLCSQGTRPLMVLAWTCPRRPGREPHPPVPPPLPLCKAPLGLLPSPGPTPVLQTDGARGCAPVSRSGSMRNSGSTWRTSGSSPRRARWRRRSPSAPGGGALVEVGVEGWSGMAPGAPWVWLCSRPAGQASSGRQAKPGRICGGGGLTAVPPNQWSYWCFATDATRGRWRPRECPWAGLSDSGGGSVGGRRGSRPSWVTRAPRGPAGSCGVRTRLQPSGCWHSSLPPS